LENQSTAANLRLDKIIKTLENQSTAANLRLRRLIDAQNPSFSFKDNSEPPFSAKERPKSGDIEFIERYCRNWQENSLTYEGRLPELRKSAQRLLQVLERPDSFVNISDDELRRIQDVESEIGCLARQPLYFTEMFHGVSRRPDGGFKPLSVDLSKHLRADGLLGVEDRRALSTIYERLTSAGQSTIRVAEIGSAAGRGSTLIAGQYIKRTGGTLYCIDPWEGLLYFAFLTNLRIFALEHTVIPIRSPSVPAASLFDDGALDAVFIDGSHIYPDVLADIDAYLPKIRKGGLIFGHDLYDVPSRFDRNELLSIAAANNADASCVNVNGDIERVDVHPGVILAVQDRFGDDVELFGRGSVVWAKQI
jgi:predicted O-methyltransferase YrrM